LLKYVVVVGGGGGGEAVAEVEGLEGGIGQSGALEFLGIDNIHVMRDSEKKLKDICNHLSVQDKGWFTALDNSRYRTLRRATHDTRHTTHDTRHTTHDTRHTTHDTHHCTLRSGD
jgi:hypothetical protein